MISKVLFWVGGCGGVSVRLSISVTEIEMWLHMPEEQYGEYSKVDVMQLPGFKLSEGLRIPLRKCTLKKNTAYLILLSYCYLGIIECDSYITF